MESIIEFLNYVIDFTTQGIYDFFHAAATQITYYVTLWIINAKIFFATVAWEVAQSLLANFNVSQLVNSAWSSLDSQAAGYINFFGLPEAFNIIGQAYVTGFVIRIVA